MTLKKKDIINTLPRIIDLDEFGSYDEGFITAVSELSQVPFSIKRVFWTHGANKDTVRGNHAHKETEEVIIAIQGSIEIEVILEDMKRRVYLLDNPRQGLYLPPHVWRTLYFSKDAISVTLASTDYNKDDYEKDMVNWLQRDFSDDKFYS